MSITAGVIAVQGDFHQHTAALDRVARHREITIETKQIRTAGTVPACDVIVLPGGESTTIARHLRREAMAEELHAHVDAGKPLLATCAGLIAAARDVPDDRVEGLNLIDVGIERNAFGRQRDSFETTLAVTGIEGDVPAVFIRAPIVTDLGPDVELLAEQAGRAVAVREPPVIGTAFHPELTADVSIHELAFFS